MDFYILCFGSSETSDYSFIIHLSNILSTVTCTRLLVSGSFYTYNNFIDILSDFIYIPFLNIIKKQKRRTLSFFYLLENCGARRAFFKPYFFLSFIRGSLVKYPAFLRTGLKSLSIFKRARAIPWRMAPA